MSKNLKYSGVNWLGDIPNDWTSIPLKRHTSYVSRGRSPSYTEDESSGIPVLNQACVYWNGLRLQNVKFQDPSLISGHRGKVRQNDLLVNSTGTGTLGRVAIFNLDADYLADSHITIVRPISEKLNAGFLYYLLQTGIYQGYIYTVLSTGATNQIELSREGLSNTPVIAPSINTQIRIATFLDRKTAAIDTLITKKQRLIELLEEKRAALINQAVTKGLNPDVPMKDSGIPWIGKIPEHWMIKRVKNVIGFVTSGSRGWADYYTSNEEDPIFLQSGNLGNQMQLVLSPIQNVNPPKGTEGERTIVRQGDILVCVTGARTGNVAIVRQQLREAYVNQHVAILRPLLKKLDFRFLGYALKSETSFSQFLMSQYGGTKQGLGLEDIKNVVLVVLFRTG